MIYSVIIALKGTRNFGRGCLFFSRNDAFLLRIKRSKMHRNLILSILHTIHLILRGKIEAKKHEKCDMPPMCADFVAYLLREERQCAVYHVDT